MDKKKLNNQELILIMIKYDLCFSCYVSISAAAVRANKMVVWLMVSLMRLLRCDEVINELWGTVRWWFHNAIDGE